MSKENGSFSIKFEDGTTFSGNLMNKDWRKIPDNKRIECMSFIYGDRPVKMENFRQYNITMEIHSVFGKPQQIVNITVAGRADNHSVLLIYDFRNGKLNRKEVNKFTEYGNMIASTWKTGTTQGVPKDYYGATI